MGESPALRVSHLLLPSPNTGLQNPISDLLAPGQPALLSLSFPQWILSLLIRPHLGQLPLPPPAATPATATALRTHLAPSQVLNAQLSSIQHPRLPARAEPDREQERRGLHNCSPGSKAASHSLPGSPSPAQVPSLPPLPADLASKSYPTCPSLFLSNLFLGRSGIGHWWRQ